MSFHFLHELEVGGFSGPEEIEPESHTELYPCQFFRYEEVCSLVLRCESRFSIRVLASLIMSKNNKLRKQHCIIRMAENGKHRFCQFDDKTTVYFLGSYLELECLRISHFDQTF